MSTTITASSRPLRQHRQQRRHPPTDRPAGDRRPPGFADPRPGASATFFVAATSDQQPSFQWRRNGVDIPNATAVSFTIRPVSVADAAADECRVTNGSTTLVTKAAALTVGIPTDEPSAAIILGDAVPLSGDTSCDIIAAPRRSSRPSSTIR